MSTPPSAQEPVAPKPDQNSLGQLIGQLLGSGDAWVKLITLALIIFSGWGNWNATQKVGDESRAEWTRSMTEIHQFFTNQQTYLEGLRSLAQNSQDTAAIKQMLQTQNTILETLKADQQKQNK